MLGYDRQIITNHSELNDLFIALQKSIPFLGMDGVNALKKKNWRKPKVVRLEAGSAEANTKPGNDGTGGHTGS